MIFVGKDQAFGFNNVKFLDTYVSTIKSILTLIEKKSREKIFEAKKKQNKDKKKSLRCSNFRNDIMIKIYIPLKSAA